MRKIKEKNKGRPAHYEEVSWKQVRSQVSEINPTLAAIIDEFKPTKKHTFIKVKYPYGSKIRDKGELLLPNDAGNLVPIDDPTLSSNIRSKLSYNPSPLAFILSKTIEIYVEVTKERTVPFKLFGPGTTFGVWEIMRQPDTLIRRGWDWSISAGARTLFMLPKITDSGGHLKLRQAYNINSAIPHSMFEHGKIFAEIFNNTPEDNNWNTEILFFSDEWLKPQSKNIGWHKLKLYWANEAWEQLRHWSNKITFDISWDAYIAELTKRKIKLKPYLMDTVKHLIAIGCGTIPGFKPADDSEKAAPTKLIQDAYVNVYGLKSYTPIIMYPDFLKPNSPVYYSLEMPTLPEKPPEFESFSSVFKIIRELKQLIDIFIEVSTQWPKIEYASTYDFLSVTKFEFFHTEPDPYDEIKLSTEILNADSAFSLYPEKYKNKTFPKSAPFFRGCVKLSLNLNEKKSPNKK